MNRIFGILLLFTALLWNACGCPPDEQTGELTLGTAAKNFLDYEGNETLIFQNSSGTQLSFTAIKGKEVSEDQLCYRTTCTEAKYNSPSSCEYYIAESERFGFFSEDNNVVLDLLLYSDVYDYGTADFYDGNDHIQTQISVESQSASIACPILGTDGNGQCYDQYYQGKTFFALG